MQSRTIRLINIFFTVLLILLPLLYIVYRMDSRAMMSWSPAIIFWLFLVSRRLHKQLEAVLLKKRVDITQSIQPLETKTQKMRRERGF